MPALFVFLLKVNVALLIFCAGYYFVLRHLTFYTLNRVYLVTAILFATIYPQINLSGFVQRHQQLTEPVQAVAFNWQAPAEEFIKPLAKPSYWYWAEAVFWAGAAILALRLTMQLYSLYRIYINSTTAKIFNHEVRVMSGDAGPFSFWKSIYVNPDRHEPAVLRSILLHEQVHVSEWHTLDILLAELSTIFYWFNPGVWLMKKAIRENIEFITDRKILEKGIDSKQYQYSLVNVSFHASAQGIVNHFNISTIKKRIIMMNAKRSSKYNLTRYAFLVPTVIGLLLVFSISKAAFAKKSAVAFKALTNNAIRVGDDMKMRSGVQPARAYVAVKAGNANINVKKRKAETGKTDTIKKGGIFISTSHHSDSLNYVINGVKSTKADFDALDADHIYAIEIMPAEKARKIIDQLNNKHSVLFVTTDDSEAGKKFKEKIDKLNGNRYTMAANVMSTNSYSKDGVSYGYGVSTTENDSLLVTNGASGKAVTLYVSRQPKPAKYKTMTLKGGRYYIDSTGHKNWAIAKNGEPVVVQFTNKGSGSKLYTTRSYAFMNNNANIEHLPAKLIMIDGKEATEHALKKLSAADIESMSVKSGEEMIKEYGDKAKNGVVFIETKKK